MAVAPDEVKKTLRDPSGINSHLALAFEEVFAEPEQVKSCDCVWKGSRACFDGSRTCMYNIYSGLCGMCIALCFGCDFACTTFNHVWCYTPQLRMVKIMLVIYHRCWKMWLDCICSPISDHCAKCCGGKAGQI